MFSDTDPNTLKRPEFGKGAGSTVAPEGGKTMFQTPKPEPDRLPDESAAEVAEEAAAGLAPAQAPAALAPELPSDSRRYLKGVRGLCKAGGFAEGLLLDLLSNIGQTDGSVTSLDELAMINPDVLKQVYDKWGAPDSYLSKLQAQK